MNERMLEKMITGFSVPIWAKNGEGEEIYRPYNQLIEREYSLDTPKPLVLDINNELEIQEQKSKGNQMFVFEELPDKILFCPKNIVLAKDYIPHEGSTSRYKADFYQGNDRLMISFLPPNSWTSYFHWHPAGVSEENIYPMTLPDPKTKLVEYYEILWGSAKIHHFENDKGIDVPAYFSVPPGINHRMESGPDGVIVGINMKNARLYPEELQHLHVKPL